MNKSIYTFESRLFASLANSKRLEILHLLEHASLSVKQIMEMTGIPQANVSQHLSILRRLGLVASKKNAQIRIYSLSSKYVPQACTAIRHILFEKHGVKEEGELNALHLHIDPICGMELTSYNAALSLVSGHHRYYFCGKGCAKKFSSQSDINIRDNNLWQK